MTIKNFLANILPISWQYSLNVITRKSSIKSTFSDCNETDFKKSGLKIATMLEQYLEKDYEVVEVGSGMGRISRYIAPKVKKLICIDNSSLMLYRLKKEISFKNVSYVKPKGSTTPLKQIKSNTINFVYSFLTFQHMDIEEVYIYLEETHRILIPTGKIAIQFVDFNHPNTKNSFINQSKFRRHNKGRVRYVTKQQIEVLADMLGYKNIEIFPIKGEEHHIVLFATRRGK